ncbi:MAG TPA: SCO family protein [Sediminibacterium sp.]|nr:SCO family protein [Sediminibacterium sp.]
MIERKQVGVLLAWLLLSGACRDTGKEKQIPVPSKLPFYNQADFTPEWIVPNSKDWAATHTIPAFSFTDQYGETVTEKTVQGKIYVADFFFTACPGICKQLTSHLLQVQQAFRNDPGVLLLSHSVTPDIDNSARLKQYAAEYGIIRGKWYLLTGNRDTLYTLARKAYFADEDLGTKKTANDFLHTENMLLIDRQRRIRGVYKGTSQADINNLIADIKELENEKE